MTEDLNLEAMAAHILRSGPSRVVINSEGEARPSRSAREQHGVNPTIIFIRGDGWSLAAPPEFEAIAYQMWRDEWIGFMQKPYRNARPIEQYNPEKGGAISAVH